METVKAGLIRFYHEIAGVGLVFPLAARPIAVEYAGYPVITLRPIDGLEFVLEAVAALGSSTELAGHLFRECWAVGTGSEELSRPFGWNGREVAGEIRVGSPESIGDVRSSGGRSVTSLPSSLRR
jgi:hypothetical protein